MTLRSIVKDFDTWLMEKQTEYGLKQKIYNDKLKDEIIIFKASASWLDHMALGFGIGVIFAVVVMVISKVYG